MLTHKKLVGNWEKIQGNEFTHTSHKDFKLLFVERTNPRSHQPPTYLLGILPDGQRSYISGIRNGRIDFQDHYFQITINPTTITIQ
jgi:hypothetical protein